MSLVETYAQKYGIPTSLANALIGQESGGNAGAVSPKGATGLTQVLPSTAAGMYGISEQEAARRLRDPAFALDAGFRYLSEQKKAFGSWRLALAAYNAGPNAVRTYHGIPPYQETQDYVRNILGKAGALTGVEGVAPVSAHGPVSPSASSPTVSTPFKLDPLPGLQALATGHYDPMEQLQGLLAQKQAYAAQQPSGGPVPSGGSSYPTPHLAAPPGAPESAPGGVASRGIVALAAQQIGQPYVWGGESRKEGGFDCSGLVDWAMRQQGYQGPRLTTWSIAKLGVSVKGKGLKPGDLILANNGAHVVIYAGNGQVIAAPHTGTDVQYQPLSKFRITDVRRV